MGNELRHPDPSVQGEAAAETITLQDALDTIRGARRKTFWGALVPGLGAVAYFVWTAVVAASPTPSITLAVIFGGASLFVWKKVRNLSLEERKIEAAIQGLTAPALDSG